MLWSKDGHTDYLNNFIIVNEGKSVVSACRDTTLRRWRLSDGKLERVYARSSVRYQGEIGPAIAAFVAFVQTLVEFLQLTSFTFSSSALGISTSSALSEISRPFQFDFGLSLGVKAGIFWVVVVFVAVLVVLFVNARRFVDGGTSAFSRMLWGLLRVLCQLSTAFGYIPIVRTLLSTFLLDDTNGANVVEIVIAAICLVCYFPLSLRLAAVDGDLTRVAVFFLRKWSNDQVRVTKTHAFSRADVSFNKANLTVGLFMVCVALFVKVQLVVGLCLTLASLILVVATLLFPPFFYDPANCLRVGLFCGVLWGNLYFLVADDPNVQLICLPFVVIFGGVLMEARLMWRRRTWGKNQVLLSHKAKEASPFPPRQAGGGLPEDATGDE